MTCLLPCWRSPATFERLTFSPSQKELPGVHIFHICSTSEWFLKRTQIRVRARGFWVLAIRIQYPKTSFCWESYFILFRHGKVEGQAKSRQWWAWSHFFTGAKAQCWVAAISHGRLRGGFWMLICLHPWPEERWRNEQPTRQKSDTISISISAVWRFCPSYHLFHGAQPIAA